MSQSKSSVASRTAFDILTVESGEESEDEVLSEPEAAVPSVVETQAKLSKTALKKAAKASRREKKLQNRASPSGGDTYEPLSPPHTAPLADSETGEPISISKGPPPIKPPEPLPLTANTNPSRPEAPPSSNSHSTKPSEGSRPTPARVPPSPPSISHRAQPTAVDKPLSQDLPPSSSTKQAPSFSGPVPSNVKGHAPSMPKTDAEAEKAKKSHNVLVRTLWTFIMLGGFLGCLLMGHVCMIILVFLCQTIVYREVTRLFALMDSKPVEYGGKDPWSKTLSWYFFATANYFLYGESIIHYFKHVVFAEANFLPFAANHRIISFTLYTIGFVGFVMSLKKGHLKQQFGLFCWVHMTLLLIVVSSHFIINNILEGLIWFFVPASLVICNDVFAYICGITMGRTPLIKLSPKKTVEGFVGAFLCTIVFAIVWGTLFSQLNYMICPVHDLGVNAWSNMKCTPNPVFVWREWVIWKPVAKFLSTILPGEINTISYMPYQFHLLFMACFASLVAPFGGFFASGFKRAFNIKDFGDSIPGHGGMTDRMDCQFLMGVFVYVYYSSFIREHNVTVGSVLQTIVSGLTVEEQLELIYDLKHYLRGQGITI
ncbi:cytidylyltransferase family-domain-containing protein [Russula ochroleuca]|uniref:Phosphatidate cytidylyltransferase n=1 Tax=Russula ochroleuca TaxID=152965 RepID=A0A9P5TBB6_9AGAM|nr:cytidylyltransferase family-domain-containing protein [Russula ochroleuca]